MSQRSTPRARAVEEESDDMRVQSLIKCLDKIYDKQKKENLDYHHVQELIKTTINGKPDNKILLFSKSVLKIFAIATAAVVIPIFLYSCMLKLPGFEQMLGRNFAQLDYPIKRLVRHLSLPFIKQFGHDQFYGLYESECWIENPFRTESVNCEECKDLEELTVVDTADDDSVEIFNPFIGRGLGRNFSIEALQEARDSLDSGLLWLRCSDPRFSNVSEALSLTSADFFNSVSLGHTFCSWRTSHVSSSRALRKIHGRPFFVDQQSEITFSKTVYIAGPRQKIVIDNNLAFPHLFLFMGHGKREVILRPQLCKAMCSPISEVLQAGDVLFYRKDLYEVLLYPSDQADYTLAIQGSFL